MRPTVAVTAIALLAACSQGGSGTASEGALLGPRVANALRGPAGPQGIQGIPGPQGLTGPTGPAGASIETLVIAGLVEDIPADTGACKSPPPPSDWVFAGPTTSVGLGAEDRLTVSGSVALGLSHPCTPVEISLTFCVEPDGGAIAPLMQDVYTNVPLSCTMHLFPVVGSAVPGAGTYRLGSCLKRLEGRGAIDSNDYATAWVQVLRAP